MSVLAIDAGTTGVTVLVVDDRGAVRGRGYREFPQRFPRPGWVEHDPEDWWRATVESTDDALASADLDPSSVSVVGITNQRETTVVWDRETLRPAHAAIVWQERRTTPLCEALTAEDWEERVRHRTGLASTRTSPPPSWPRCSKRSTGCGTARRPVALRSERWMRTSWPASPEDGCTPPTTPMPHARCCSTSAGSTGIRSCSTVFASPRHCSRRSGHRAATSAGPIAGLFGGVDAPIAGIAGDQQAALIGQACFQPGDAKNTYGTGSFVLLNTGTDAPSVAGLLTTVATPTRRECGTRWRVRSSSPARPSVAP